MTIETSGGLGPFSIVSESLTDDNGTTNKNVLRLPAGMYLMTARLTVFGDNPAPAAVANPWSYRIVAKDNAVGWNNDPFVYQDGWRDVTASANQLDLSIIPEYLLNVSPVYVTNLNEDPGFGKVNLKIITYDNTAPHLFSDGQILAVGLTLRDRNAP